MFFGKDGVSINCTGNNINIQGISFDYNYHYGRVFKLARASNITIKDCIFKNVGTTQQEFANGMLLLSGECSDVSVLNCLFLHCKSSARSSAQGIWIQQKSTETLNHHIIIKDCYFDDFQTIEDADAIKVLGGNYDCHLYVENCEFHRCGKRAMKFQGRECHSRNNKIYVTEPMHCAIAFQRGFGSSSNDTIFIDYDGESDVNNDAGLLYRTITIAQGHVTVEGLNMITNEAVINSHQAAIGLVAYGEEDSKVVDVVINNSFFSNGGVFLKVSDKVKDVDGLKIRKTEFTDQHAKPIFSFQHANVRNAEVDMDVLSTKGNTPKSGLSAQTRSINKISVREKQ